MERGLIHPGFGRNPGNESDDDINSNDDDTSSNDDSDDSDIEDGSKEHLEHVQKTFTNGRKQLMGSVKFDADSTKGNKNNAEAVILVAEYQQQILALTDKIRGELEKRKLLRTSYRGKGKNKKKYHVIDPDTERPVHFVTETLRWNLKEARELTPLLGNLFGAYIKPFSKARTRKKSAEEMLQNVLKKAMGREGRERRERRERREVRIVVQHQQPGNGPPLAYGYGHPGMVTQAQPPGNSVSQESLPIEKFKIMDVKGPLSKKKSGFNRVV